MLFSLGKHSLFRPKSVLASITRIIPHSFFSGYSS